MDANQILIIAGPNGAGKTTFATEYLPNEAGCPLFVNADLIAAGLSPFGPEDAAITAGRIMLKRMDDLARRGVSFAFETTLAGHSYEQRISRWRNQGYKVVLYFLSLPDVDTAILRVAERVAQGGHSIPEQTIRRRYAAGLRNFESTYKNLVSTWTVYDNSGKAPILIDWGQNP